MKDDKDKIIKDSVKEDVIKADNTKDDSVNEEDIKEAEKNKSKDSGSNILDGMVEITEYSETNASGDNSAYVNDRDTQGDESVEGESASSILKKGKLDKYIVINKINNSKIVGAGRKAQSFLGSKLRVIMEHPVITVLLLALFCELFIETMSRSSFIDALGFAVRTPVKFILNYFIVLAPFLIALFVKKKLIPYVVFLAMWMTVGIIDFYLLSFRTTPFTGVDIDLDFNELEVAVRYMKNKPIEFVAILLVMVLIVLLVFSLVFICPKSEPLFGKRIKAMVTVAACWFAIYFSVYFAAHHGVLSLKFGNLGITYHDEGIAYSLLVTIVDTGMSKPEDYSRDKIEGIVDKDDDKSKEGEGDTKPDGNKEPEENGTDIDKLPNIIFIQLESFIDPTEVTCMEYSEDPIPFFRSLRKNYSSGYCKVPTIVAGTCNTEFEMITGMRLDSFGPGEYPYKTILRETTCESMAYVLRDIGYNAHAIHNNKATFYGRNVVYSHFGFETFTSIETMCNVEETPNGWAKDMVLVDSIMDCLNSTEGKDLVFTVSVQSHGTYDVVLSDEEAKIKASGAANSTLDSNFTYYVNEEREVDDFLRELVAQLSACKEDVVLVLYGDHIPGLNLNNRIMKNHDIYTTEYVIWDNIGLEKIDEDIPSYRLAATVFDRLGIHDGTLFKFHQDRTNETETEEYDSDFYALQYDMLYGDKYVYGGENPFEATDIQYGIKEVKINTITPSTDEDGDDIIYIEGENFNKFSKVFVDDEKEDAEYISQTLLKVDISADDIEEGSQIVIKQINTAGTVLRESEPETFIQ